MTASVKQEKHDWAQLEKVIVFDGVCNFCNAFVDFVIGHDPQGKFKFGTLQSGPGQEVLIRLGLHTEDFETFLLLEQGKVFTKSTAALKIAKCLTGPWPLLAMFLLVPRSIRDGLYDFIARRRYRWMGKRDTCRMPSSGERERFI
ncbi:MAG: thiol-disulfide oxidoreductase DCC family protein [Nitrospirota bacterium]|nr:MAG: thiol-disulfide oxidoreductase DCC family protein [Nitrospirota bacterium]